MQATPRRTLCREVSEDFLLDPVAAVVRGIVGIVAGWRGRGDESGQTRGRPCSHKLLARLAQWPPLGKLLKRSPVGTVITQRPPSATVAGRKRRIGTNWLAPPTTPARLCQLNCRYQCPPAHSRSSFSVPSATNMPRNFDAWRISASGSGYLKIFRITSRARIIPGGINPAVLS